MELRGTTAVVTGAASGLGAATAVALAAQGVDVLGLDLASALEKVNAPIPGVRFAAADVTPNSHIRARVTEVTDKVRQGVNLHRAMEEARCFPAMMVAMVASGEASGDLGTALDHAATEQQRDLDAWVRAMVALVEPAILVIMGGLVMSMVLAILLPIMSLNNLVDG